MDASYATDTARVRYDPERLDEDELPGLVSGYGYRAHPVGESPGRSDRDEETVQRLLVGGLFAMLVMPWYVFFLYPSYVGIETGILSTDMTTSLGLYLPMGIIGLFTTVVVFYTGWPILRGAYVSVRTVRPNMDLLLSIAILAAFSYSTVALLSGSIHLYYDVAIAIVLVVTAGGYYEGRLKRQATGLLSELTRMRASEATRRREDGSTETVAVDDLEPGDEVLVRPGERVPIGVAVDEFREVTGADAEVLAVTRVRPGMPAYDGSFLLPIATDPGVVAVTGPSTGGSKPNIFAFFPRDFHGSGRTDGCLKTPPLGTDGDSAMTDKRLDRRTALKSAGAVLGGMLLAGCSGDGGGDGGGDGNGGGDGDGDGNGGGQATVEMITEGGDNYFDPIGLQVEPGTTVTFENTSGAHNSVSYDDRIPSGAETWDTTIGETAEHTFETEGTYDYFCRPHKTAGMVGRIVVGEPGGPAEGSMPPDGDVPDSDTITSEGEVAYEDF